ncbi:hypothetical protein JYQ62_32675 [Nostoc sp. UHCC 0702]|nr:hypothetical protein JYQ62_32675 [Nostoc sp. UHCC 0702]
MSTDNEPQKQKLQEANNKKTDTAGKLNELKNDWDRLNEELENKTTNKAYRDKGKQIKKDYDSIKESFIKTELNENKTIDELDKIINEFNSIQQRVTTTKDDISNLINNIKNLDDAAANDEKHPTAVMVFGIASGITTILYGVSDGLLLAVQESQKKEPGKRLVTAHAVLGLLANTFGLAATLFSTKRRDSVFDNWDASLTLVQMIPNFIDMIAINQTTEDINRLYAPKQVVPESQEIVPLSDNPAEPANAQIEQNQPPQSRKITDYTPIIGAVVGGATIGLIIYSHTLDTNTKTKDLRLAQYICLGAAPIVTALTLIPAVKGNQYFVGIIVLIDMVLYVGAGGIQITRSVS